MHKNTASQKYTFFAFDYSTGAPKTGDAANITIYQQIDDGTVTALTDTSASELDSTNAKGSYVVDLTQAETNGNKIVFTGKSSTSNVAIVPQTIYTVPAAFGNVAGAANGLFIAGSNAATTVASLTSTGSFTISDGLLVSRSTSNASAIVATGNGTGSGFVPTGGATGYGINAIGGSTSGAAIRGRTTSGHALDLVALGSRMYGAYLAGPSDGSGGGLVVLGDSATSISDTYGNAALIRCSSASATGNALYLDAANGKHGCGLYVESCDNEAGVHIKGGPTGHGLYLIGGATAGSGMSINVGGSGSSAVSALTISTNQASGIGISVNSSGSGGTAVSLSGHTTGLAIDGSTAASGYGITVAGGSSGAGTLASGKYGLQIISTSHAMYLNNSAGSSIHCMSGAGPIAGTLATLTTYTGNTLQTGDSYAIVSSGTHGNAALKTLIDTIDTVVDSILVDTAVLEAAQSEPSAVPAANASPLAKLAWLAMLARNKIGQTATTQTVYADNGSTAVATSTLSDDGTTLLRGELT